MIERFCQYRKSSLPEDQQSVIDGIILTAIDFICKHEMAHFFRSHLTFSHGGHCVKYIEESDVNLYFAMDSTSSDRNLFLRAIESDADTQATVMVLREMDAVLSENYWNKKYPDMKGILKHIDDHALYDFINLNLS